MRVDVSGALYLVKFRTVSEIVIHDPVPPHIKHFFNKRVKGISFTANAPAPEIDLTSDSGALVSLLRELRRYARPRSPRQVSDVTTRCWIYPAHDTTSSTGKPRTKRVPGVAPVATGISYYSKSERTPGGRAFSGANARARALKRALGMDITHREGRAFTPDERDEFWRTFSTKVARANGDRQVTPDQAASSPGRGSLPLSSEVRAAHR